MRIVFLVPRRSDGGHRDKLWVYCKARWQQLLPDIPIYEGEHTEGPFNRSAAVNRAAWLADQDERWDFAIVIDSDVMYRKSQAEAAIARAVETGKVTWGHRRWRGIREDWAVRIVADRQDLGDEFEAVDMDVLVERTNPISWSCFQVFPRAVWDDMGGFDERFVGWGYEDMAVQSLVCGLYGHERVEGDVIHLWHERSEERIVPGQPATTASPEYHRNARYGRRYMVAARRLGFHDRMEHADEAEMARDIANLLHDDEKVSRRQTYADRQLFDGWWPSLEELRDGAKEVRRGHDPDVAIILRTGGEPGTWPQRSAYLRESIASLESQVRGTITMRRIYSDWGPEHLAELEHIGLPFGYRVVGPDRHVGYIASVQALWGYIERNVRAPFVFLAEDDFLYEREIELEPMARLLNEDPYLAQVALLREPYYPRELDSPGILGWPLDDFTRKVNRLEHRLFFTMNPSLVRRTIVRTSWPSQASSERAFGDSLLHDPRVRFAFWGQGEPWLQHIGAVRAAAAY